MPAGGVVHYLIYCAARVSNSVHKPYETGRMAGEFDRDVLCSPTTKGITGNARGPGRTR